jgi:hypothetical protein
MKHRLFNLAAKVSLVLCIVTFACWTIGVMHPTVWACRTTPARSWFIRFERQHLILSDQQMVPKLLPAPYTMDSTYFREFWLRGPRLPEGEICLEISPQSWKVRPPGAWFRKFRTGSGGFQWKDNAGAIIVRVEAFFGTLEVPWWSLLVSFSVLPAWGFLARLHMRSRRHRGLCCICGYNLRATPHGARCPECGTANLTPGSVV